MKKILVIDDKEISRNAFTDILKASEFSAIEAPTGKEGVQIFIKEGVSAVILDIELSDMNGIEVLKELKRIDPDVPIIMVSASISAVEMSKAKRIGSYDFFAKPPNFEKLILSLKEALEEPVIKNG